MLDSARPKDDEAIVTPVGHSIELSAQNLRGFLQEKFRLQDFRKGQLAILQSVLSGRDTIAVMPTGGGKSLCYQLPAAYYGRLVVVISPLIALMQDQVRGLRAQRLAAGCLHSGQSDAEKREIFAEMKRGGSYLLYLSPERVQKPGFADWLKKQDVALIAIDEAHCVSQWGPDFRQDYGKLSLLRKIKPTVPILALTATATPQVLDDIAVSLDLNENGPGGKKPDRHVYGFYRPNLFYQVTVCDSDEQKSQMIVEALRQTPSGRILIYCGTRATCESMKQSLAKQFDGVDFYHAGLSAEDRVQVQSAMAAGKIRILCATNAFGMGIDYPDVRLVVHFQMPANIESFYQEMGRAGRDGQTSRCLLLYAKRDRSLQSFFIQQSKAEPRVISSKWRALDAMTLFAEGGECRHAGILTYFRDSERLKACGHCDICVPTSPWVIRQNLERPTVITRTRKAKKQKPLDRSVKLESPEAEVRAEVLREWRRSYAEAHDIAAFIVFSNRTLIDLANKNPKNSDSLLAVYGFGEHKVSAFGHDLLKVLAECTAE